MDPQRKGPTYNFIYIYINDSKIKNQSSNPYQFEPKILYLDVEY